MSTERAGSQTPRTPDPAELAARRRDRQEKEARMEAACQCWPPLRSGRVYLGHELCLRCGRLFRLRRKMAPLCRGSFLRRALLRVRCCEKWLGPGPRNALLLRREAER